MNGSDDTTSAIIAAFKKRSKPSARQRGSVLAPGFTKGTDGLNRSADMTISKKRTRKIRVFLWILYHFVRETKQHGKDSKCHEDMPNERSGQSSEFVSLSRDLREISRKLEEHTAKIDFGSDSIKRLGVSMASAGNVGSLESVISRKLRWLATHARGISMDAH
jgi:hypothetical protein